MNMKADGIISFLDKCDIADFTGLGHSVAQHRIFGFITTNIRRWTSFIDYIQKIVPEYKKRKSNLPSWKGWCYSAEIQQKYKQIFKRFELAGLMFRNLDNAPGLNNLAESLYDSINDIKDCNRFFVPVFLAFYLLKGRYWQIDNQPLIEINKIINSYSGDFINDSISAILEKKKNRLFLFSVFYNPSLQESEEIAWDFLKENSFSNDEINKICNHPSVMQRIKNAGGEINFLADIYIVLNYYLLQKSASIAYFNGNPTEEILERYAESFFNIRLNECPFARIPEQYKADFTSFLREKSKYINNVILFAQSIKEENQYSRKSVIRKTNIKENALQKYAGKCFFHFCGQDEKWHEQSYFTTKRKTVYLEAHHVIKLEHSQLFNSDLDIVDNLIPLCPNCHRKIHNAEDSAVAGMLRTIYSHIDKKAWIKKGIFIDIDTLASFYGLSKDMGEYK